MYYIFLFMFAVFPVFAGESFDPNLYRRFVVDVKAENGKKTWLILTDGTTWGVPYTRILCGEEIFLTPRIATNTSHEYLISSSSNNQSFGELLALSWENLPVLVNINKLCVKEAGWYTAAEYVAILDLSDGSRWKTKASFKTIEEGWSLERPVLISSKYNSNQWIAMFVTAHEYHFDGDKPCYFEIRATDIEPYL